MGLESKISAAKIVLYGLPFVLLFAFGVEALSWFSPEAAGRVVRLAASGALLILALGVIAAALRLLFAIGSFLLGAGGRS